MWPKWGGDGSAQYFLILFLVRIKLLLANENVRNIKNTKKSGSGEENGHDG